MTTDLNLRVGLNAITQYRRLDYTPWHAIAEFVDNSTQSYLNHKDKLDLAFQREGEGLRIDITYERDSPQSLRVVDNAMGMSIDDLDRALHVARPPENSDSRSKYGLGMKTAACWIGNYWTITTKKMGSDEEITVEVDVEKVANGNGSLETSTKRGLPSDQHYTIVEITQHNKEFKGRTLGKIQEHLRSMYRMDLEAERVKVTWRGVELSWEGMEKRLLRNIAGDKHKIDFSFEVDGKTIHGWAGVLETGKRPDAGFAILQYDRVIRGAPSAWRPERIFGVERNDTINQRLVGEVHLDGFEVTHTKDNIQWHGDQEELVEKELAKRISGMTSIARQKKKCDPSPGPSQAAINTAVSVITEELKSPEIVDSIQIDDVPEEEVIESSFSNVADDVEASSNPRIQARIGNFDVLVYLSSDMSFNDPYCVVDSAEESKAVIIINLSHPYIMQLDGQASLQNYLKECIFDGLAAHHTKHRRGRIEWHTVSLIKDRLLRLRFEMTESEAEDEEEDVGDSWSA